MTKLLQLMPTEASQKRLRALLDDGTRDKKSIDATASTDAPWDTFLRSRLHLLRRGVEAWPEDEILMQMALEHAEGSPITDAVELWLQSQQDRRLRLREARRPQTPRHADLVQVFEGHHGIVLDALELTNGKILSWSLDATARLWDRRRSRCLAVLNGHAQSIHSVEELPNGILVTRADGDPTIRWWDSESGEALGVFDRHTGRVVGWRYLGTQTFLSWDSHGQIYRWSLDEKEPRNEFSGHEDYVAGTLQVLSNRLLSWSHDKTLRLWDWESGNSIAILEGHEIAVTDALALQNRDVLSYSRRSYIDHGPLLCRWDPRSGKLLVTFRGHRGAIRGASELRDGRIVSWSSDRTVRIWEPTTGTPLTIFKEHGTDVEGVLEMGGDRLLSWDISGNLHCWHATNGTTLEESPDFWVKGAWRVSDSKALLWNRGGDLATFRPVSCQLSRWISRRDKDIWLHDRTLLSGSRRVVLQKLNRSFGISDKAHGYSGADLEQCERGIWLRDGSFLAFGENDPNLRIWSTTARPKSGLPLEPSFRLPIHRHAIEDLLVLPDGRFLTRSEEAVCLWGPDGEYVNAIRRLEAGKRWIQGVKLLDNARILVHEISQITLWDMMTLERLATLKPHQGISGYHVIGPSRILTQSYGYAMDLWDYWNGRHLARLDAHVDSISGVGITDSGNICSWELRDTVLFWNGRTGQLLSMIEVEHGVQGFLSRADGTFLLWTWREIRVHADHDGSLIYTRPLGGGNLQHVEFHKENRALVRCSWGFHLLDVPSGDLLMTGETDRDDLKQVVLVAEDRVVAWGSKIYVWSPSDPKTPLVIQPDGLLYEAHGPLGDRIFTTTTSDYGKTVDAWNLVTGQREGTVSLDVRVREIFRGPDDVMMLCQDYTLHPWTRPGEPTSDLTALATAPEDMKRLPDLVRRLYAQRGESERITGDWICWDMSLGLEQAPGVSKNAIVLAQQNDSGQYAVWHTDMAIKAWRLLPSGKILAVEDTCHPVVLAAYQGLRRFQLGTVPTLALPNTEETRAAQELWDTLAQRVLLRRHLHFEEWATNLLKRLSPLRHANFENRDVFITEVENRLVEASHELRTDLTYAEYHEFQRNLQWIQEGIEDAMTAAEDLVQKQRRTPTKAPGSSLRQLARILRMAQRGFDVQHRRFLRIYQIFQCFELTPNLTWSEEEIQNLFRSKEDYEAYRQWEAERESELRDARSDMQQMTTPFIRQRLDRMSSEMRLLGALQELAHRGDLYLEDPRVWRSLEEWNSRVLVETVGIDDPRVWDDEEQARVHEQYRLATGEEEPMFAEFDPDDLTGWTFRLDDSGSKIWGKTMVFSDLHRISAQARGKRRDQLRIDLSRRTGSFGQNRATGLLLLDHASAKNGDPQRYLAHVESIGNHCKRASLRQLFFLLLGLDRGILHQADIEAYRRESNSWNLPPQEWLSPQHEVHGRVQAWVKRTRSSDRDGRIPLLFAGSYLLPLLRQLESDGLP